MKKIIACIDGSIYADKVCTLTSWVASKTNLNVSLLHVVKPHTDIKVKTDMSGAIGIGAKTHILEDLVKLDEEHGKIEQKKGSIMLEHAMQELSIHGIKNIEILHKRGAFIEIINEIEDDAKLIIIGKRGENAQNTQNHLGANLERLARSVHTPILVASEEIKSIENILIAYDGSKSSDKIISFVANSDLFKDVSIHLIKVSKNLEKSKTILKPAELELKKSNLNVITKILNSDVVDTEILKYIKDNDINLLSIGAYGHSKIRNFILGSKTSALILKSNIPVLLFR